MRPPTFVPSALALVALVVISGNAGFGGVVSAQIKDDDAVGLGPHKFSPLLAPGDFNRDGIPDLIEATPPAPHHSGEYVLTLLVGQPDGSYRQVPSHHLIGKAPRALVVGDFNGDGNPDVIVGDVDGVILEFLGDGKGNLSGPRRIATLASVASIASGHFTHEGKLDLAVSDPQSNAATILLGAGDGSFRVNWSFQLPRMGVQFHLAAADFNKDGIADLVITNEDDENYEVMLGNGNGTFTYAPELSHLKDPYSYCPS